MEDLRLSQPRSVRALEKLGADLEALLLRVTAEEDYSDAAVVVEGRRFPVHRCILAARCPGLRKALKEIEQSTSGNLKVPELALESIVTRGGRIGPDAFLAVLGFVYGAKVEPWPVAVPCYDGSCSHLTCRPALDYVLEVLCAAQLFDLPEVVAIAEQHLVDCVGKLQVDDMLWIHQSPSTAECTRLQSAYLTSLASKTLNNLTLEKLFSGVTLERVKKMRGELGNHYDSHLSPLQEMQCKRIHRALDSDDVELVRMLVDEKKLDLDGAHGLHYAAAYCHPGTLAHLLDLSIADINLRNERNMTALHVATWRSEPKMIANLLEKGAQVKVPTGENQTALDIARRLAKKTSVESEDGQNERICIALLEQAEKKLTQQLPVPMSAAAMLSVPSNEEEIMEQLVYLENRVALARLLYPREADIIMGISHLDTFANFTGMHPSYAGSGIGSRKRKGPFVDLNLVDGGEESKEAHLKLLRERCDALRKAVEMGRRCFPCYSGVVDKYFHDDIPVEANDGANIEEQLLKKKHFAELRGILQDSFPKAKVDEHKKMEEEKRAQSSQDDRPQPTSPSSTSTSQGTSSSMVTKL